MGIENALSKMPKKRRKLLLDLTAVGIIFTMIYGFYVGIQLYSQGKGFMAFFNMGTLTPIIVMLVFLFLARSLLQGKQIKSPNLGQKKPQQQKQQPRPRQPKQTYKKPYVTAQRPKKVKGSVRCPRCGTLVVKAVCPSCGWRR